MTKRRTSSFLRRLRWLPLFLLLLVPGYAGLLQAGLNWHQVTPEFYRSGQPDAEEIAAQAQRYGIKSIINLRGENEGLGWYDAEITAAEKAGVQHYDFRMSSKRVLTVGEARALVRLMSEVPKPVWIHCRGGADRTGLAAALYVGAIEEKGMGAARWQLSPYYGHIPLPLHKGFAMDRSLTILAPLVGGD